MKYRKAALLCLLVNCLYSGVTSQSTTTQTARGHIATGVPIDSNSTQKTTISASNASEEIPGTTKFLTLSNNSANNATTAHSSDVKSTASLLNPEVNALKTPYSFANIPETTSLDSTEYTIPNIITDDPFEHKGNLRKFITNIQDGIGNFISNLLRFVAIKVKYSGFFRPSHILRKISRFLTEIRLRHKPIKRFHYHMVELRKGIVIYFRPTNLFRRNIVNLLNYLAVMAKAPEVRRRDGLLATFIYRFLGTMNSLSFYKLGNFIKRILGLPLLWRFTLGPPDEYNFLQLSNCENSTAVSNSNVTGKIVKNEAGECMYLEKANDASGEVKEDCGDIVVCANQKCTKINFICQ